MKLNKAQRNVLREADLLSEPGPAAFRDKLVKAQMVFDLNGQQCMNVLYFLFDDTVSGITMAELATDITGGWDSHLSNHLSNQMVLNEVIVTDMSAPGGVVLPFAVTPPIPGGNTSSDPAPFIALSVRKETEFGGRAARGFMRIAGVVGAQFTAGMLTTTAFGQLQSDLDGFYSTVGGGPWLMVIASFYSGGVARTVPLLTSVLGLSLGLKVTTQNSRKIGRGV